jgi:hypothetical protein
MTLLLQQVMDDEVSESDAYCSLVIRLQRHRALVEQALAVRCVNAQRLLFKVNVRLKRMAS